MAECHPHKTTIEFVSYLLVHAHFYDSFALFKIRVGCALLFMGPGEVCYLITWFMPSLSLLVSKFVVIVMFVAYLIRPYHFFVSAVQTTSSANKKRNNACMFSI